MATWARGVNFKNSDNTKNIGGIGIYGNDTTAEKLYIGLGTEPWNNAGIQLTSSAINFKGNKIYHAGDKPTLNDIGAAAASHTHSVLTGINDTRSTEYSPGTARNDFKVTFQESGTNGVNDGGNFYSLVHLPRWANSTGGYGSQIALTDNENIWYRKGTSDTAWTGWKRIWHSGNFDPNTKFQSGGTYGTLYLTDWFRAKGNTGLYFQDYGGGWYMTDSTWVRSYAGKNIYTDGIMNAKNGFQWNGQSLDSRYAAATHSHSYIPLTGSTGITGPLRSNAEIQTTSQNAFRAVSGNYGFFIRNDGANTYFMLTNSGDQYGNWNNLRPLAINNSTGVVTLGNGAIGNLQGNASTATKLAASKTIALSGDATGSASFDGSANATINATVRKTCLVGSDAETAAGWYKVASQTMSGYGNTNITFAVTSTYSNYHSGILQLQIRSNNTSISCNRLAWHTRIGLSTSHYVVNISGMTWTLYAYQSSRHARLMFEVMSQSSIDNKNTSFAFNSTTTKESATPTATVTSSDAATVATANTLTTARNIKIGNTSRSFNGSGDVTWTLGDIGAAASSHTHTTSQITDATSNNIANTIVKRDGSGNISVGTIAGSLSGNATTATTLQNTRSITIGNTSKNFNGGSNVSWSHNEMSVPKTHVHYTFGGNQNAITTAQFISLLVSAGAFQQNYWISRGSWSYAQNQYINDTGCGNIHLAGSTIEVIGSTSLYTIRIHTPTTSASGVINGDFIYVNNGTDYSPGWRRIYNDKYKPSLTDIGAASASHNHDSNYVRQVNANGYYGITSNGSTSEWVRTTLNGLIPYQSGGSSSLGTSSWPFNDVYANNIYDNGVLLENKFADKSHSHSNYLSLSGGTVTGAITSSLTTSTHIAGNRGTAIINSTAAGSGYNMLAKMNSTNGVWTMGGYGTNFLLMYTANSVISAGTNGTTKSLTLLNESGNSYFPGTVTAPTFSGNVSGNATTATTLQTTRKINGTAFNGSADITTANWGTSRNITIGNTKKGFNGSGDIAWNLTEIGAAPASHTHTNYVQTSDYSLTTISKTLTIGTSWMDTGITGTNLASGSYMVQVSEMSSSATSFYSEIWTGVMSWYSADTNSTDADEIILHKAGHASNGRTIYLRTLRVASNKTLKLQICASTALNSTNVTFKFRKII